ncbi:MAG TPA: hypothetical protein VL282_07395, partial [Tepidisphaeraceae bacterium]|nr:hypothetical protein [Tepidisphaeraceae bacterium]
MSKKKPVKTPTAKTRVNSNSPMDVGLLEQMVKLMAANDLNTVDVRDGEKRVILKRGAAIAHAPAFAVAHHAPVPAAPASAPTSFGSTPAVTDETAGLIPIKSPMVGTFYAAPSPDAR